MTIYFPTFKVLEWLLIASWTCPNSTMWYRRGLWQFGSSITTFYLHLGLGTPHAIIPLLQFPKCLECFPTPGIFGKCLLPGKIQLGVISFIKFPTIITTMYPPQKDCQVPLLSASKVLFYPFTCIFLSRQRTPEFWFVHFCALIDCQTGDYQ